MDFGRCGWPRPLLAAGPDASLSLQLGQKQGDGARPRGVGDGAGSHNLGKARQCLLVPKNRITKYK